jgi:hypothetical protein
MMSQGFLYNASIVRFNGTPFFTGNGSASSAGLVDRHGNPISAAKLKKVSAIHRADWQGRQLLYPMARINQILNSQNFTASSWAIVNASLGPGAQNAPDGTSSATLMTSTASAVCQLQCTMQNPFVGGALTISIMAMSGSCSKMHLQINERDNNLSTIAGSVVCFDLSSSAIGSEVVLAGAIGVTAASNTLLPSGFRKVSLTFTSQPTCASLKIYLGPTDSFTARNSVSGDSINVWGASGGSIGAYVSTTTTPVTVTDYALSGSTVSFGQVPAAGAVCDWDGVVLR